MFNSLDLLAISIATAAQVTALVISIHEGVDASGGGGGGGAGGSGGGTSRGMTDAQEASRSLLSVALFLMWLRALRLLAQFPSIGPLVLMVAKMTRDVAKWAMLLMMILAAFVSALHTLYRDKPPHGAQHNVLDHDCIDFDTDFESWPRAFILILEGTLTSENWLECARLSSHAILGSALMYGCQAMVAVLLFNMLSECGPDPCLQTLGLTLSLVLARAPTRPRSRPRTFAPSPLRAPAPPRPPPKAPSHPPPKAPSPSPPAARVQSP